MNFEYGGYLLRFTKHPQLKIELHLKNHKVKPWVKLTKIFIFLILKSSSKEISNFPKSPERKIQSKDFHMKYLFLEKDYFSIATSFTLWLFYLKRLLTQVPKLNEFVYNFHMTVQPVNSATGQLSRQLLLNFSS